MVSLFDEYGANEPPPMPGVDPSAVPTGTIPLPPPPPPSPSALDDSWAFGGGSGDRGLHLPSLPVRRRRRGRPKGKIRKPGTIFGYLFDDDPNAVRPAIPPREPWSEDETDKRDRLAFT